MSLEDFPGYLGITSQGVIAIHADWPIYPAEHGRDLALRTLGQFPRESVFRLIDDIDQCWLFIREPSASSDPFAEQNYHVALWEEDAHELLRCGYIVGAQEITFAEWVEQQRKRHEGLFWQPTPGNYVPNQVPEPNDFGDERESFRLIVAEPGIQLTTAAWSELERMLATHMERLHPIILTSSVPIARIGQFDAAVREACLRLEVRLRSIVARNESGQRLIERFVARLNSSGKFVGAYVKVLRGELRAAFKFVRNDFMHELKQIDETECYAILSKISDLQHALDVYEAELQRV